MRTNRSSRDLTRIYPLRFNKIKWTIPTYEERNGIIRKANIPLMEFDERSIHNATAIVIPKTYNFIRMRVKFPFQNSYIEEFDVDLHSISEILGHTKSLFFRLFTAALIVSDECDSRCIHKKNPQFKEEKSRELDSECSICLQTMKRSTKLDCGHLYHSQCIREWYKQENTCPMCRCPIVSCDKCFSSSDEYRVPILNCNPDALVVDKIIYNNTHDTIYVHLVEH